MNLRDTLERLGWTFVSAFGGIIVATDVADLFNTSTLKAAGAAGLVAAVNALTLIARSKVPVLPDPGDGLPGLPTDVG